VEQSTPVALEIFDEFASVPCLLKRGWGIHKAAWGYSLCICIFIYLLIDWLIYWLIYLLIDWFIDWFIYWLIDLLIDLFIYWLIDWFIDWYIYWLIDLFIHVFTSSTFNVGKQRDVSFECKNYVNLGVFRINHWDLMIDTTVAAFLLKLWMHQKCNSHGQMMGVLGCCVFLNTQISASYRFSRIFNGSEWLCG
jgi:hypothetical protein